MTGYTPPGTAAGTTATGTAAAAGATAAAGTAAQPAVPAKAGLQIDIGVSSTLKVDDNFQLQPTSPGTSTILDNGLTFGLSSVTGVQDLSLTGSGVLRYGDIPGRSLSGFEDPTVRLRYRLDGVNSQFTLTGRYRHVDREFLDPFQIEQEETNAGAFYAGGGTMTVRNAGLSFVTGINDPVTFTLGLAHDEKDYDATALAANARLFGNKTDSANATVALKLSPVTSLRFNADFAHYTAEDTPQTDRTTTDYSIGVVQDINPVLVLDAQIGFTEVETDTTTGTQHRDGVSGAATLTQTLANGTAFVGVDSTVNQNGTRESFRFGRSLQLPLGTFSASLGGTHSPSGNTYAIATLAYDRQLRSSNIAVSLNRAVSTNNVNEDVLDTRLTVAYGYEINNNSRLDFSANWGRSESAGIGNAPTIERTSLRAAYSYDLTQDWALTGGVLLRHRSDSSAPGDAQSNSVFLTLGRTFSYRP
ncbi:hypothetical protein [Albidovulum sp.]|uniref:hypothetical protein n=1 Tax=Albidovulum sp. TaxID=1872424 RepID=UPI0039B8E39C